MELGQRSDRVSNGLVLPIILVVVSLFVFMVFETGQAIHDRGALS